MGAPYRVLHVLDTFGLGGAQEVVRTHAEYCDTDRYSVSVAALHGRGPYLGRIRELGVEAHSLSPSKKIPLYLPNLYQLLRRAQIQVGVFHLDASMILGVPAALAAKTPVRITYTHVGQPDRRGFPGKVSALRHVHRRAQACVAVSSTARDFLVGSGAVPSEKVHYVRNGIDVERYSSSPYSREQERAALGVSDDTMLVVGAGRLVAQKNFALFLQVVAETVRKGLSMEFAIAGVGPEDDVLKQRARELRIEGRVRFLGYVEDVRKVLSAADVFMLTSDFEGTPIVVMEAMAQGLPVIASRVDGTTELVDDAQDGLLVEAGDCAGFVSALARMAEDSELRTGLGERASSKAGESFSGEAMVRSVELVYWDALERAGLA